MNERWKYVITPALRKHYEKYVKPRLSKKQLRSIKQIAEEFAKELEERWR